MESVVRNLDSRARRPGPVLALVTGFLLTFLTAIPAQAKIDCTKGRIYKLSPKCGPWMIMVTSVALTTADKDRTAESDKTAADVANQLVYQLRLKGIPAYVYKVDDEFGKTSGADRFGRPLKRTYKAQHGMIGIVAGNYDSLEEGDAQKTLKWVKQFVPKVTVKGPDKKPMQVEMGLSKAFLARNPLLSDDEMQSKIRDPLMVKINTGVNNSLTENSGKYSLIVASFYGNSQVKPAAFNEFDKGQRTARNISLENAALESQQLCAVMRSQGHEAYVYHERFRSIVTVGSFKSKNDPQIARLKEQYQAKYKRDDRNGQDALVAEAIKVYGQDVTKIPKKHGREYIEPGKAWTMDPVPELIERFGNAWQPARPD